MADKREVQPPIANFSIQVYEKQYSEEKFWIKIANVAKNAGIKVIYMALLLYYALDSTSLSVKDRALIIGALGYFILPLDFVSDLLPAIGFLDDAAILLAIIKLLIVGIDNKVVELAKGKLSQWFGDFDESEIQIS